jgi:hypothetical protein
MRSPKQQTWGWSSILGGAGETAAALRHKLQRGLVEIESGAGMKGESSRATLWDIARLRVSRHLCDIGFEAGLGIKEGQAFGLAKFLVNLAYKELIDGEKFFTKSGGERQKFLFAVFVRVGLPPVGPRIILVDPDDSQSALEELALQTFNPQNVIVPIHKVVLDAWSSLPDLPGDVAVWMQATSSKMSALELHIKALPR